MGEFSAKVEPLFTDGVLALATIILTLVIPNIKSASRQRAATFAWMAVTIVLFSALVKIFKLKNGGTWTSIARQSDRVLKPLSSPGYPFRMLFG